ncbi:MAG TPA: hypothetical protein VFR08_12870 [Candidatus Angelobacter sp.]|nr:hypothetical protein [Candidatus Angelobacter sp.]
MPKLKHIDPDFIEKLAGIGCTIADIASVSGCPVNVLERDFASPISRGRANARMVLRQRQWDVAMKGSKDSEHANASLLIWLGKQILNQHDKQEITGTDGGAIQHEQIDLSRLTEAELAQLEAIVNSAQS